MRMKMDTKEFDKTLLRYAELSKKSLPDIINTKAYYVAAGAQKFTEKAELSDLKAFAKNWDKSHRTIIKTYGLRKGQFDKKQMMNKFYKYRKRTVAYIRAGWRMAVSVLGRFTNLPRRVDKARVVGRPKGGVKVAKKGTWSPTVSMWNTTGYTAKQAEAVNRYGQPALMKAFAAEMISMKAYIEAKLKAAGTKAGVKLK